MTDVKHSFSEGSQAAIVASAGPASGVPLRAAAAQQEQPSALARSLRSVTSRLTPTNYNMASNFGAAALRGPKHADEPRPCDCHRRCWSA